MNQENSTEQATRAAAESRAVRYRVRVRRRKGRDGQHQDQHQQEQQQIAQPAPQLGQCDQRDQIQQGLGQPGLQQAEEPLPGEDDHDGQVDSQQKQQGKGHAEDQAVQAVDPADLIQLVHGLEQGAQPRRGGQADGEQAGQQQGGGLALGNGGDIVQIVQNEGQALPGEDGVQGGKDVLRAEGQQADEEVDAHEQGEQGQDQEIGQGGGGPGHAQAVVGVHHAPHKGNGRQAEQRSPHGSVPPLNGALPGGAGRAAPGERSKKPPATQTAFSLLLGSECSGQLAQLNGHAALLVGGIVLVQQPLDNSLVHSLDGHLVSDIGLAAVAFRHRGLKLLDVGLERGLRGLVLHGLGLGHQDTLLGRLDIRQTKHLLRFLKSIK